MKKLIKTYIKNPMLLIFLLILIFFTPMAIYSPGENKIKGVVTAIGIDKMEEQYEVSLLTFIPTANQTYKQQNAVISGKGESVTEAIYNAQLSMGRSIGLAHAKTTVVSEDILKQEDVAQVVDHISRISSLPENTVFICTNGKAKELLESTVALESELGLKLEQLIGFNASNLYSIDTSLEAFYRGYYSDTHSSIIGELNLTDPSSQEEQNSSNSEPPSSGQSSGGGQSQSSENGSSSGGGAEQGQSKGKKTISNQGESVILKNGEMVAKLSSDQLNALNLINPKSINQIINIDDVSLEGGRHDLAYRVRNKRVLKSTKFENGYPVFAAQVILGLELTEVDGENQNLHKNTEMSKMTQEIKDKLNLKLKNSFTDALKILVTNRTDIIDITQEFFRNDRKGFQKFIKGIDSVDEFIEHVNFKVAIIVAPD